LGNFRQHITCSTVTGIAVGGIAYHFGFSLPVCAVAAGLCSFAGMLPDIDSDTSKSFHECINLTAGIGCILTASKLRSYDFIDADFAMLGGVFMFLFIRFVVAAWIKKLTTHRGMIHSIPMALLSGEIAFFVVTGEVEERLLKAAALTIGYLSHLILDEVYSIDSTGATLRLKKSFGTALKWTNPKKKGAVTTIYMLMFLLGTAACTNPEAIEQAGGDVATTNRSVSSNKTISTWWSQLSGSVKNVSQSWQSDVQREALEFLSQQDSPAVAAQSYSQVLASQTIASQIIAKSKDSELSLFLRELTPMIPINSEPIPESELPPAMQIGNDWNRLSPIQPASIGLPR
jgi:membrane-bound metal-dependent hydrolase YbcI (DUF457 family)